MILNLSDNCSLEIKTKPLDIVYNANLIKRITEFFEITKSEHRVQMELAGMQNYIERKQRSKWFQIEVCYCFFAAIKVHLLLQWLQR